MGGRLQFVRSPTRPFCSFTLGTLGPLFALGCAAEPSSATEATSGDASTTTASDPTATETGDSTINPEQLFNELGHEFVPLVNTVARVHWRQELATDRTYLRFRFEDQAWHLAPGTARTAGEHHEVILGAPEGVEVIAQLVSEIEGQRFESPEIQFTNGSPPDRMPRPTVLHHDEALASHHRWLLGAVSEASYLGPHWIYIIDRRGRVVWYYRDLAENRGMYFPRPTRDGTHLTIERRLANIDASILFTTLDRRYEYELDLEHMCDCYDTTEHGTVLFNTLRYDRQQRLQASLLREIDLDGQIRDIWDCETWARSKHGDDGPFERDWCYSNTVHWHAESDSILLSFPYQNTIVQIDRQSGELLAEWGDLGDWTFDPPELGFEFQHWANFTDTGNLVLSSHMPGGDSPGTHRFMEFALDYAQKTLTGIWIYGEGIDDWAHQRGMAQRIEGGNTLGNYGTGGIMRELTPDHQTAWHLLWEGVEEPRLLGHNLAIDDLYALNRGPRDRDHD